MHLQVARNGLPREQKFVLEIFPHAGKRSVETGQIQAKSATRKICTRGKFDSFQWCLLEKNIPKLKFPFNFGR